MSHPLVEQLRFVRSEFRRALADVDDADARRRFLPMNCISWNIGHLAWQETALLAHRRRKPRPAACAQCGICLRRAGQHAAAGRHVGCLAGRSPGRPTPGWDTVTTANPHHTCHAAGLGRRNHLWLAHAARDRPLLVPHRREHGDPPVARPCRPARFRGRHRRRSALPPGARLGGHVADYRRLRAAAGRDRMGSGARPGRRAVRTSTRSRPPSTCASTSQRPSLPDAWKARLLQLRDHRITDDGVLVIKAQRYRSQERNRADALAQLQELVRRVTVEPKKRRATAPTAASRRQRIEGKKQRGQIKALRGRVRDE
jgi:hypothetical protein